MPIPKSPLWHRPETSSATSVLEHSRQTPYSDTGQHGDLFTAMPTDPESLSAIARNVIVHYRACGHALPDATRHDIHSRWLEAVLAADQNRHREPLDRTRPLPERVQGCCRDHTLFCVGVLRSHGIPARSRVGFAGYFVEGWHHDHVVVEAWLDGGWRRFDSEVSDSIPGLPSPTNLGGSPLESRGFVTAAQAWACYRRGDIDLETYGVGPEIPVLRDARFVLAEVIHDGDPRLSLR